MVSLPERETSLVIFILYPMKKIYLLPFLLFFFGQTSSVQAQAFDWAQSRAAASVDVCMDPFGNSFTAGQIVGTVTLGSYSFTSAGAQDIVVAKYSPSGNLLWAQQFGGSQSDYSNEIQFDGNGGIWVTGQFSGSLTAGSFTLTSTGGTDAFLVKLNASNGQIVFAEKLGGSGNDVGVALDADGSGKIYVAGTYTGNANFGSTSLSGWGGMDVFILQLNTAGVVQWSQTIAGTSTETLWTMAADASGNVYIGGFSTSASTQFGSATVSLASTNHFIAKFDNTGTYIWSALAQFNGEIYGLSIDAAGSVYFTGNFDTQIMLGAITLTNSGPNDDILLVKINNAGAYCWARNFGSTSSDQGYDLKCSPNGDLFLTGSFEASFSFGSTIVNAGSVQQSYVAKLDSAGNTNWVVQTTGTTLNYANAIAQNNAGDIYIVGVAGGPVTFGNQTVTVAGGNGFLVKLADNANIIQGTIFRDLDNNGMIGTGETGIPNALIQLNTGPYLSASNNSGVYQMYTAAGTYSVSLPSLPLYHTLSTGLNQTATFIGLGSTDTANHFGLFPIPNVNDLRITVTPVSKPKAGYVLNYLITCTNVGTTTQNATVNFTADSQLSFVQSSPVATSQSGQSASWNLGAMAPQSVSHINVLWNVDNQAILGDTLLSTGAITPVINDSIPADNTENNICFVVGPYDPNYKEVQTDSLTPSELTLEPWLSYTVHFQNIGNDSANTVIIKDSLSQYLNLPTLEITASSHPMTFSINNTGIGEFRFDNIMLPDSNTNPVTSCGFVKYRVKPLTSVPSGDSIPNYADIYFDYNPAITTNTASTYIYTPMSAETEVWQNSIKVFPVPSTGIVHISCVKKQAEGSIHIFNLSGQKVYAEDLSELKGEINREINLSHLPAGIYFGEIRDGKYKYNTRILLTR